MLESLRDVNRYQLSFYLFVFLILSALSYAVYVTPLNVNDFLMHLFLFETQSLYKTFHRAFIDHPGGADWRPLQLLSAQIIYKFIAQGQEHLVFKGMLVGSLFLMGALFVRILRVQNAPEVLAGAIALLVLIGHHSFGGAVEAVYPYGVEITLLICEFAVIAILLRRQPSGVTELLALLISIFAICLNEKGGLVGVTYIVGSVLRLPGGTLRSAALVFSAYVLVVCHRFLWVSSPRSLLERSEARDYTDALFDIVAPVLNILISDPRSGAFRTISQVVTAQPWAVIYFGSSVLLSAVIVVWAWRTVRRSKDAYGEELKVAAILPFLLAGSAMFGAFSRKDYVPIVALGGYAVVSFYALKWLFTETLRARQLVTYSLLCGLAAGLALTWSLRTAGLFLYMRKVAFGYQYEWAFDVDRLGRTHEFPASVTQPIIARLRPEGLARPLGHPYRIYPRVITYLLAGRDCPELCRE